MIQFPSDISAILAEGGEEVFYAARLWSRGSNTNIWTGSTYHSDVTLGGHIYAGNSSIVKIDNVQLVSSVDRSLFSLTLSDATLLSDNQIDTGLVGKLLEVRIGFINPLTGGPLVNSFIAYKGLVDSVSYTLDTNVEGGELLTIGAASPVNDLGMKRSVFLTRTVMRKRNPNDSSCDQITSGSTQVALKWGKSIKTGSK